MNFWYPIGLFLELGKGSNTVLGSTNVVEQLSSSMLPLILTFNFDFILGSFLTFCGHNGGIFGVGIGFKNCFGVSSHRLIIFVF